MAEILRTVFNVRRVPKTARATTVGDFETLEQAERAMLDHYKSQPKRGRFDYRISEDELENIGGTVFRRHTISLGLGAGPYYKRYEQDELKSMCS